MTSINKIFNKAVVKLWPLKLYIIMDTIYVSVEDRLAIYRALDIILNSEEDCIIKINMFIAGLDTHEKRMIATEYYDRNKVVKPVDDSPYHTYKDPFEEDDRNDVWQDMEEQLAFDNLPTDYWKKLYANPPVRREQKDRDEDTYTGRPSFFADHDSDEYQEALEAKWDREDREVERKKEQGL